MQHAPSRQQVGAGLPQLASRAAAQHELPAKPVAIVQHLDRIEHRGDRLRLVDENHVRLRSGGQCLALTAKRARICQQAAPLFRIRQVVVERRRGQEMGEEGRLAGLPRSKEDMHEWLAEILGERGLKPPINHRTLYWPDHYKVKLMPTSMASHSTGDCRVVGTLAVLERGSTPLRRRLPRQRRRHSWRRRLAAWMRRISWPNFGARASRAADVAQPDPWWEHSKSVETRAGSPGAVGLLQGAAGASDGVRAPMPPVPRPAAPLPRSRASSRSRTAFVRCCSG